MSFAMTQGPNGPKRSEDGGARICIAGLAVTAGDLVVPDYADSTTLAAGAAGTVVGLANYPESVFVPADGSDAGALANPMTMFGVATESAAVGKPFRAVFEGYVEATCLDAVTAGWGALTVSSAGHIGDAATGELVIGMATGAAISAGEKGQIYIDGTGFNPASA